MYGHAGLYEKWKDKNKAQIQREGEDEDQASNCFTKPTQFS